MLSPSSATAVCRHSCNTSAAFVAGASGARGARAQEENEELGREAGEGRVAGLERQLALALGAAADMRRAYLELEDAAAQLDAEAEELQLQARTRVRTGLGWGWSRAAAGMPEAGCRAVGRAHAGASGAPA